MEITELDVQLDATRHFELTTRQVVHLASTRLDSAATLHISSELRNIWSFGQGTTSFKEIESQIFVKLIAKCCILHRSTINLNGYHN